MGDSGRKLADVTRSLGGGLPEANPTLATDGHDITLKGVGGTVNSEYLSVMFDLTGGSFITVSTWLYYPDVENVSAWQEVSIDTISDALATANTFLVVPSFGATRAAFIVQSETGGVTDVSYTIRSISMEDAQIMVDTSFGSPAAAVSDVNVVQIDSVGISAAAGVTDVAVVSIPETTVDLVKVAGTATVEGGVSGSLGTGGLAAHDAAAAGNPNRVAGVYRSAAPSVGDGDVVDFYTDAAGRLHCIVIGEVDHDAVDSGPPMKIGGTATAAEAANVGDGDRVQAAFTLAGRQRIDSDLTRIGGNTVVTGGTSGSLGTGGLAAHDAAAAGNPNRMAGVYRSVDPSVGDGDICDFLVTPAGKLEVIAQGDIAHDAADSGYGVKISGVYKSAPAAIDDADRGDVLIDAYGRVQNRSIAYDDLSGSDFTTPLFVDSFNHDTSSTPLIDTTNISAATHYYPSSAGEEFGDRNKCGWMVAIRDLYFEFEVSNDGSIWDDATAMLIHVATGLFGYDATYFTEPDMGTIYFGLLTDKILNFRFYRFKVVAGDNSNVLSIYPLARAV